MAAVATDVAGKWRHSMAATRPPSEVAAKGAYTDDITIVGGPQPMSSWVGWSVFAAVMLVMAGVFQGISGLIALFNSTYYAVSSSGLAVSASYTTWGSIHLRRRRGPHRRRVLGAARPPVRTRRGSAIAMLSAISNLVFLQAAPVWGAIVITIDVLVIYALTVTGGELNTGQDLSRAAR